MSQPNSHSSYEKDLQITPSRPVSPLSIHNPSITSLPINIPLPPPYPPPNPTLPKPIYHCPLPKSKSRSKYTPFYIPKAQIPNTPLSTQLILRNQQAQRQRNTIRKRRWRINTIYLILAIAALIVILGIGSFLAGSVISEGGGGGSEEFVVGGGGVSKSTSETSSRPSISMSGLSPKTDGGLPEYDRMTRGFDTVTSTVPGPSFTDLPSSRILEVYAKGAVVTLGPLETGLGRLERIGDGWAG